MIDAIQELLQKKAQHVRFHERRHLVAELELLQDLLDVGREAVEVGLEVGSQLLLPPAGGKVAEAEGRGVVEGFAGGLAQRPVLVRYSGAVQLCLHAEHRFFRRLQNRVQAADDRHGQDDVAVLAPHVDVAQHVVCDAPYEAADVESAHLPFSTTGLRTSVWGRNALGQPTLLQALKARFPLLTFG